MTEPYLIVETPRGGEAGHRFLVPPAGPDETTTARIVDTANQDSIGPDYVSVSRQVIQRLANGATREGTERIILVGIAVKHMQPDTIEQVKNALGDIFPSLDTLVQTIQWSASERSTVTTRAELGQWVTQDVFGNLPLAQEALPTGRSQLEPHPRKAPKSPKSPVGFVIAILLVLCLVGGWWLWSRTTPSNDATGLVNGPDPAPSTSATRSIEALATEWGCTPDQLVTSLLRASNWDRRRQHLTVNAALADDEVMAMLDRVGKKEGTARFLVSPAVENQAEFRRFVEGSGPSSVDQAKRLRQWLYEAWTRFDKLQDAAGRASDALKDLANRDDFAKLLIDLAVYNPESGFGEHFEDPATPLFDRQDVMIYRMLNNDFRNQFTNSKVFQALPRTTVSGNDLPALLVDIRANHNTIKGALDSSRKDTIDTVIGTYGGSPAEDVHSAYQAFQAFQAFLDHLSTFNSN